MFVAALLDAFPEHWPHVQSTIASLKLVEEGECTIEIAGEMLQVKIVERPGGIRSGKAEATDVASHRGRLKRTRLREEAVERVLSARDQNRDGAGDEAE